MSAPPEPEATIAQTINIIDRAERRDQIGDAILRYTIGRFECAALFLVRDQNAIGWLAQAPGLGAASLDRLNVPLGGTSIFQVAHDSGKPYRGAAVSPGHPYESELWNYFALDYEPEDLHLVPIKLDERVVNLLYAHSRPGTQASYEASSGLIELARQAEKAYQRIISAIHAS